MTPPASTPNVVRNVRVMLLERTTLGALKVVRGLLGDTLRPLYSHWTEGGGKPKASHTKLPILDVFRVMYWGLEHDPWRNLVMVGGAGVEGLCKGRS